ESRGRIYGSSAIIAPWPHSPRTGTQAHGALVIRSRTLAGNNDVPLGEPGELDNGGARKTTRSVCVWVGDGEADQALSCFIHGDCRIDQAISVGRYDITLLDDIRRQRAGSRQCRPEDEPGKHIASKPIAVLLAKGRTP